MRETPHPICEKHKTFETEQTCPKCASLPVHTDESIAAMVTARGLPATTVSVRGWAINWLWIAKSEDDLRRAMWYVEKEIELRGRV